ncbi:MAG: amidohydrolase family protein [Acidobacteriia bacterium]|nr:amidohydrolase family protein [Terriglobia bacterium]
MKIRIFTALAFSLAMVGLTLGEANPASVVKSALVKAGRVLDVKSGQYLLNQGILIEGGIIRKIGALDTFLGGVPDNTVVIDLSHATILPGLIDCHAHLLDAMDPTINGADELTLTITKFAPTKRVLLGAAMAREELEGGFTTVRVVGHSGIDGDVSLRDAIRNGWVPGPRIVASARKITPYGGQAQVMPFQSGVAQAIVDQEYLPVSNPEEGRRAVLENLRVGADLIKVVVDEGARVLNDETMKAIVTEAHRVGVRVAAHATSPSGIQVAIDAGVDSIEHADEASAEQFQTMRDKGIYLVPTLWPRDMLVVARSTTNPPPGTRPDPEATKDQIVAEQRAKLDLARKVGVKMAFGSDEWYAWPDKTRGQATRRLLEALQTYGMPPADALRAATVNAADLLNIGHLLGSLEPGKYADLIALEGDPLTNLVDLEKVRYVMKGGVVVRDDFHPVSNRKTDSGR